MTFRIIEDPFSFLDCGERINGVEDILVLLEADESFDGRGKGD